MKDFMRKAVCLFVVGVALTAAPTATVLHFGPLPPPPVEDIPCEYMEICFLGICVPWGWVGNC